MIYSTTKPALNLTLGGNALGTASDQLYRPDGLVKRAQANSQPIIFVGINYRLGSMQFRSHQLLKIDFVSRFLAMLPTRHRGMQSKQMPGFVTNVLPLTVSETPLDMARFAVPTRLIGVHDNIEAFGGDPNKVSAIGHSVGGSSIGLHLTSYGGKRGVPFQKAMWVI